MTYRDVLSDVENQLKEAGVPEPKVDAWELVSFAFSLSKKEYLMRMTSEVDATKMSSLWALVERRASRVPLQQILRTVGFWGLSFSVNEHVLCPRQDTELLVEKALTHLKSGDAILDLCTGSGCVLISLAYSKKGTMGVGVDISPEAITVAKENAKKNFVHVDWKQGDLFEPVSGRRFDVIVSNPPYIPSSVIEGLMPEVRDHEPRRALDGGEDGLVFYRRIVADAPDYICHEGWLLFEVGVGEAAAVEELLFNRGFSDIQCFKDYAGNERVVCGQWIE